MFLPFRSVAVAGVALSLAACAALPREQGYAETHRAVESRRGASPVYESPPTQTARDIPAEPLDAESVVRLALVNHPRVRQAYARIGLGRAELEEARRLANPGFGFSRLRPESGEGAQITRSLSWGLSDLLMLPLRKRLAQGALDQLQNEVAAELIAIATEAEVAWFEAVGAQQILAMRALVAQAAGSSADLAQRFHDAGNIHRLQLEQERAAAATARNAAARAAAEAMRTRGRLAAMIGLPVDADWTITPGLHSPPEQLPSADELVPLALEARLDLAAARQQLALREDALGITRRWRWLGSVEFGYEREREPDGERKQGPHLEFELPIFDQGQGRLERARAELEHARASLDALAQQVHDAARVGLDRMAVARDIAERYRVELVPLHESIVGRTQERVNFMLVGVFELLRARQGEYDAYQAYLEAVRDYWIARAELRGVVGGRLPDDGDGAEAADIDLGPMLPRAQSGGHEGMHGHGRGAHRGGEETGSKTDADPHAAHRALSAPEEDARAGHRPPPATAVDQGDAHEHHDGHDNPPDAPGGNAHHEHQQSDSDEHPTHDHGDRA
jgi:cobalt-zinc-cadmium efflux system outer membrane protein